MIADLWFRLRALLRRSRAERDLDDELKFHVESQTDVYVRRGLPPEQARRRALLELGGVEQTKEECREARGIAFVESIAADLRYGVRVLSKSPAFTAVAVISLALGIGANTAVFSVVNHAVLASLPVRSPGQLVQVTLSDMRGATFANLDREYVPLITTAQSFSGTLVYRPGEVTFRSDTASEHIRAQFVSGSYYSMLGVAAVAGRTITVEDDRPSAPPAAVLAYNFWKTKLSLNASVIGKTVEVDGTAFTIVGVAPPGFFGVDRLSAPDVFLPLRLLGPRTQVYVLGRLAPGVSPEQARAELTGRVQNLVRQNADRMRNWSSEDRKAALSLRATLIPAASGSWDMKLTIEDPIRVLAALAGALLLIACLNVANLLLGRATARGREIGIRLSLGAARRRIVRQLVSESLILAIAGGALGLAVAFWFHSLLLRLVFREPSFAIRFGLEWRVLAFTAGVSILCAVLFGVFPALRATRMDLSSAMKTSVAAGPRRRLGPARALVALQVAASLVLLTGAALFVRTLRNLGNLDAGFERERLLLVNIDAGHTRWEGARMTQLADQVTNAVAPLPGVLSAAVAGRAVFGDWYGIKSVWVQGYTYAPNENQYVAFGFVGPGYFPTTGIPVLLGREFTAQDGPGAPMAAIVNEAFVRRYLGGRNPIGGRFGDGGPGSSGKYEIVGVVRNAKYFTLRGADRPAVFHPLAQYPAALSSITLHVHTAGSPAETVSRVREAIRGADPALAIGEVRSITEAVQSTLKRERMFAILSTLFGGLSVLLCSIGLYGIAAYGVTRRTAEIGLRMALGAPRSGVVWMVLRQTIVLVAAGVALGVPAVIATTRLVEKLLFGVKPMDPQSISAAVVGLAAVAILAAFVPARRASRVDPLAALRYE